MNSQFSYELDERQIRITMQSAEVDFNESVWQRFEAVGKTESLLRTKRSMPSINLSISRSIIVPIFFIALIGGLSVLLFSFVDFKKKEEVVKEKPLIIAEPIVKKAETIAPIKNTAVKPTTAENKPVIAEPTTQNTNNSITAKSNPINAKPEPKVITVEPKKEIEKPVTVAVTERKNSTNNDTNKNTKKKKRRRMVAEELPTINATPATLTSSEPELDIK